ncbi:MAG: hypothetical protein JWN98_1469 [Abditibacteriota bacterium]|nr:hypothetical protein [Abditibacteriota bacterium]
MLSRRQLLMRALLAPLAFSLATSVQAQSPSPLSAPISGRVPATPLIAHDPYFSVWSMNDTLNGEPTKHWTGSPHPLTAMARIDGTAYRLMGSPADLQVPLLQQTATAITPTRSIYRFGGNGVQLDVTFTSPLLPDDIEVLSRPVTYVSFRAQAVDGKAHDVSVWFDASPMLAVNTGEQAVKWNRANLRGLSAVRIGSVDQPVLQKAGDNLRIDWGHLYLAVPQGRANRTAIVPASARATWANNGLVAVTDDASAPRAASSAPVLAATLNLGRVGNRSSQSHLMVAYDDEWSIQLMNQKLRPFWRRTGTTIEQLLPRANSQFPSLLARCDRFDAELLSDARRVGGEPFARLVTMAYRQTLAAHKVAADHRGRALHFSKENFSNGCIATVDVTYPASPFFLLLNPTLLKGQLIPVLDYAASPRWKWPFAPHDLGTYPKANGQVYGGGERTEENQMPVEESGNMLIMLAALAQVEGNAEFSRPYWPILQKWANYLREKGLDPENQLSTDDFAGHLAHNTNLSIKAIIALGGYAQLADRLGHREEAASYRKTAQEFATRWIPMADDGDHFRLAFDKSGTWSQKYNLVWDKLLGLNLFPASVAQKEMAFYNTKMNAYGLPLDNRRGYTKLDWCVWTATMATSRQQFDRMIAPLDKFLTDTPNRVPMTDWFETENARHTGFQARSVVGGVLIPFLADTGLWSKWSKRAGTVRELPPGQIVTREVVSIVPTSLEQGLTWQYTTEAPVAGWQNENFDDTSWKIGQGGFGTSMTPGANVRTQWNTSNIWLRRKFTLPATLLTPQLRQTLSLLMHHDEDAEVFINGVLAGNIPGYTSSYDEFPISAPARAALKAGENTIAIHVRQSSGGQYIDAGLVQVIERVGGKPIVR